MIITLILWGSICTWETWDLEKLNNLPAVIQLDWGARIGNKAACLQRQHDCPFASCLQRTVRLVLSWSLQLESKSQLPVESGIIKDQCWWGLTEKIKRALAMAHLERQQVLSQLLQARTQVLKGQHFQKKLEPWSLRGLKWPDFSVSNYLKLKQQ